MTKEFPGLTPESADAFPRIFNGATASDVSNASRLIRRRLFLLAHRSNVENASGTDEERLSTMISSINSVEAQAPCVTALKPALLAAIDDSIAGVEAALSASGVRLDAPTKDELENVRWRY